MRIPGKVSLWDHQRDAILKVAPFIDAHTGGKSIKNQRSALVNIPTGGGKTAVIGVLGHWHPKLSRVLVVSPRTAIRNQLAEELAARRGFFQRCGFNPATLPKQIIILNSASDLPKQIPQQAILVSTIQLINDMAGDRANSTAYDHLARGCDAVIVDEGHYEPAYSWSQALRGLGRPIVLVTATPYRNDLRQFEFDNTAIHVSRYCDLMNVHILRKVDVTQISPFVASDPGTFIDSVLKEFVAHFGQAPSSARKLIIRCKSKEQIEQIGELARGHRYGAGGILCLHERFSTDPARPWECRQPSDPEAPGAPAIWIHQHKLLEGVDGPSFRVLAFYGMVGSSRALVQQVGRVIRNPQRDSTEKSLMMDHTNGVIEGMWERFLQYDEAVSAETMRKGIAELAQAYEAAFPPVVYVDGQFRRRFEFGIPPEELTRSLRLPLRCHLHQAQGTNFRKLSHAMETRLIEDEYPFYVVATSDDEIIIIFEKIQAAPLIVDHYFMERELHAFVAARVSNLVAVLDTSRTGIDKECALYLGKPISRTSISRLLTSSPQTTLVDVNLRNASMAPSAVRKRSASAASLAETPPALDEFQFVAISMTAADHQRDLVDQNEDSFSVRSVGFGAGRVTDISSRRSLQDWRKWAGKLSAAAHDTSTAGPTYLKRFAKTLDQPPAHPWPKNVLLDLDDARNIFVTTGAGAHPLLFEDCCADCRVVPGDRQAPREIRLVGNGQAYTAWIAYDELDRRYELASDDLDRAYRHSDGTQAGTLTDYINAKQAFVVIPDSAGAVYSEGGFFDPRLGLGAAFNPDAIGLSSMLITVPALRTCVSEKGDAGSARAGGWAQNSVFRWVDDNFRAILPDAELLICDDGSRETCDFLLVGPRNGVQTVIMVHAKAAQNPSFVSASSLHDVCGQAAKQVSLLAQFGNTEPPQRAVWGGTWVGTRQEGTVTRRIRHQVRGWRNLDQQQIWKKLASLLAQQSTDREVVLALGAALDPARLYDQARRRSPTPHAIHCVRLLKSTMAAVGGVNARLRVFCG